MPVSTFHLLLTPMPATAFTIPSRRGLALLLAVVAASSFALAGLVLMEGVATHASWKTPDSSVLLAPLLLSAVLVLMGGLALANSIAERKSRCMVLARQGVRVSTLRGNLGIEAVEEKVSSLIRGQELTGVREYPWSAVAVHGIYSDEPRDCAEVRVDLRLKAESLQRGGRRGFELYGLRARFSPSDFAFWAEIVLSGGGWVELRSVRRERLTGADYHTVGAPILSGRAVRFRQDLTATEVRSFLQRLGTVARVEPRQSH